MSQIRDQSTKKATFQQQVLPNFLIVGAAKSGTTSLYYYLKQHPDIFMPHVKETFFLSGLTEADFPSHFGSPIIENEEEYRTLFTDAKREKAVGEACVAYLYFYEQSIPRIQRYLGTNTKIIIVLRNPIQRAYSHYLELFSQGLDHLSFEEAVKQETFRREMGEWWWASQYVSMGLYYEQVRAYIDTFPRDQVHILLFDQLATDALQAVQDVFTFLAVDNTFEPNVTARFKASGIPYSRVFHKLLYRPNIVRTTLKGILPTQFRRQITQSKLLTDLRSRNLSKPTMSHEVENRLKTVYTEDVNKLANLLDRDLSHWLV